jgi:hypothetical protein
VIELRAADLHFTTEETTTFLGAEGGVLVCYSITVKGHLDPRWSEWFDGLTITNLGSGQTIMAGRLPDQAALHGVLAKIRDLGLPIISVICDNP